MVSSPLESIEIAKLATLVEEAIRSTGAGVKRFVEPARGTLQQATSRTHSIVFGRRGSGKSSLLRKAAADLTLDRRPIAYVDLETFKGHSYPDVLLSVLIKTFSEFEGWLRTAAVHPANKTSFWTNLFGTTPNRPSFNRKHAEALADTLQKQRKELEEHLYASDEMNVQRTIKSGKEISTEKSSEASSEIGIKLGTKIGGTNSTSSAEEIQEVFQRNKVDFLHRHILQYQEIFHRIAELSGGDSFLFLDDLYYIRRADQARVIDYFHRIAKGNGLWLKIGTIRHRTDWYIHGDPPYGLKLGDDAHEVNLDLTLEDYSLTKNFLIRILDGFIQECGGLTLQEILVDTAIDRLVLASGGVARDFLGIFRRSITVAQARGVDYRGPKIGTEDVNTASGGYASTKKEEFKKDTVDDNEHTSLEESFQRIRKFCVNQATANLFLVDPFTVSEGIEVIQELVDLRLIHKVNSRVTVSKRQGKIFEAYMLDVSEYALFRKRRGFEEIIFWGKDRNERMRRITLILDPNILIGKQEPINIVKETPVQAERKDNTSEKIPEQASMFDILS